MPSPVLERIYPGVSKNEEETEIEKLHFERYYFAGKNIKAGIIADIACGAGYGSFLLATEYNNAITKIFAVDNSSEAIDYAKNNFSNTLIDFIRQDGVSFQFASPINTIISLETIEHLPDPGKFIKNLATQLETGGRFIASAPVTPSMDANPYHLHDFTIKTFKKLFLDEGLVELQSWIQIQKFRPLKLIGKRKGRNKELRKNLLLYYCKHPKKLFLRLSSLVKNGFCNKYLVVVFEKK